jgi:hypothetical protein
MIGFKAPMRNSRRFESMVSVFQGAMDLAFEHWISRDNGRYRHISVSGLTEHKIRQIFVVRCGDPWRILKVFTDDDGTPRVCEGYLLDIRRNILFKRRWEICNKNARIKTLRGDAT